LYNAIINPIAKVLGFILDVLFKGLDFIGIGNIAVAIIIFTLLVKLCMMPLTFKQLKMTKLNSLISPELKEIQAKYKGKTTDPNVAEKMRNETKALYDKYGVSQMGGCIQLLIQFPILMALYGVFQKIPIYIQSVKVFFMNILGQGTGGIMDQPNFADIMNGIVDNKVSVDWSNIDSTIVAMNSFTADQWEALKNSFSSFSQVIADNQARITDINTCFGVNMSQVPTFTLSVAAIIPILAGLSQYLSVKISQGKTEMDSDNPAAASMKMMTIFMPLMSVFIGFSVPAGLGIYWIATAVIQTIIQVIVNRYYDKIGTDEIIKRNVEKRNKKRAKKGLPPEKIAKNATASTKRIDQIEKNKQRIDTLQKKKEANDKKMKEIIESTNYYKSSKPGSLAEKAGMVAKYNEKNKKNK